MKTASEWLAEYRKEDAALVEEFNKYFSWVTPSLEQRIAFLQDRLLLTATALTKISEALINEQTTNRESGVNHE